MNEIVSGKVNIFFSALNYAMCKMKRRIKINGIRVKRFYAKMEIPTYNDSFDSIKYSEKGYYFIDFKGKEHKLLGFSADATKPEIGGGEVIVKNIIDDWIKTHEVYYKNGKIFDMFITGLTV